MRVLVTGGTGFLGAHCVHAIVAAGHEVALLLRDPARVAPALDPLQVDRARVSIAAGDVLDVGSLKRAADACDALLHCASVYSFDPRRSREIRATNLTGAQNALGVGVELGMDPIIHVSSFGALLPTGGRVLSEESPVGRPYGAYARSKADQEHYARGLQAAGAPVVITYPGAIWGPDDPHDGESTLTARNLVRGRTPFVPRRGAPIVDVRDLATAHAAVLEAGKGPRRFMLGGHYTRAWDMATLVFEAAGRSHFRVPLDARAAYALGRVLALPQHILPFRLPVDPGTPWVIACDARVNNGRAERELGIRFRPTRETVAAQVSWMIGAGRA